MRLLRLLCAFLLFVLCVWFVASIPADSGIRFGQQALFLLAGVAASTAIALAGWRGFSVVALVCLCSSIGLSLALPATGISIDTLLAAMFFSVAFGSWSGIGLYRKLCASVDRRGQQNLLAEESSTSDELNEYTHVDRNEREEKSNAGVT